MFPLQAMPNLTCPEIFEMDCGLREYVAKGNLQGLFQKQIKLETSQFTTQAL